LGGFEQRDVGRRATVLLERLTELRRRFLASALATVAATTSAVHDDADDRGTRLAGAMRRAEDAWWALRRRAAMCRETPTERNDGDGRADRREKGEEEGDEESDDAGMSGAEASEMWDDTTNCLAKALVNEVLSVSESFSESVSVDASTTNAQGGANKSDAGSASTSGAAARLSSLHAEAAWLSTEIDVVTAARRAGGSADGSGGGRFAFVDGALVRAMEQGAWLVLDDVNLCTASVLDRLNPLLERDANGELSLTECAANTQPQPKKAETETAAADSVQHHHRIVRPHPRFRLFLHADPANGDVSRAMRNRCVELALTPPLQPDHVQSSSHAASAKASDGARLASTLDMDSIDYDSIDCELALDDALGGMAAAGSRLTSDALQVLARIGVPGATLPAAMLAAHTAAVRSAVDAHVPPPTLRTLGAWARALLAARVHGCAMPDGDGGADGGFECSASNPSSLATAFSRTAMAVFAHPTGAHQAALAAAARVLMLSTTALNGIAEGGRLGQTAIPFDVCSDLLAAECGVLVPQTDGRDANAAAADAERDGLLLRYLASSVILGVAPGRETMPTTPLALRLLTRPHVDAHAPFELRNGEEATEEEQTVPVRVRALVRGGAPIPRALLVRTAIVNEVDRASVARHRRLILRADTRFSGPNDLADDQDAAADVDADHLASTVGAAPQPPPDLAMLATIAFARRGSSSSSSASTPPDSDRAFGSPVGVAYAARRALVRRLSLGRALSNESNESNKSECERLFCNVLDAIEKSPAHATLCARRDELARRFSDDHDGPGGAAYERDTHLRGLHETIQLLEPQLRPARCRAVAQHAARLDHAAAAAAAAASATMATDFGHQLSCVRSWREALRAARLIHLTVTARMPQLIREHEGCALLETDTSASESTSRPRVPLTWLSLSALLHRYAGNVESAMRAAHSAGLTLVSDATSAIGGGGGAVDESAISAVIEAVAEVVSLIEPLLSAVDATARCAVHRLSNMHTSDDDCNDNGECLVDGDNGNDDRLPVAAEPLLELLRMRDGLARCMLAPVIGVGAGDGDIVACFPWARFLLHRRWLYKAMARFVTQLPALAQQTTATAATAPDADDVPLEAQTTHAVRVLVRLDEAAARGAGGTGLKDTLWKRGGHPRPPRVATHAEAYETLVGLADALAWRAPHARHAHRLATARAEATAGIVSTNAKARAGSAASRGAQFAHPDVLASFLLESAPPPLFVTRATRAEILEALCMAQWAFVDAHETWGGSADSESLGRSGTPSVTSLGALLELPLALRTRLSRCCDAFRRDIDEAIIVDEATFDDDDNDDDDDANHGLNAIDAAPSHDAQDDEQECARSDAYAPWGDDKRADHGEKEASTLDEKDDGGGDAMMRSATDEVSAEGGVHQRSPHELARRRRLLTASGVRPISVWPLNLCALSHDASPTNDTPSVYQAANLFGGENGLERWSAVQLNSFTEQWIALEETDLVAQLLRADATASFEGARAGAALLPRLMHRLERFVGAVIGATSRSPADAQPYQLLLWALQAHQHRGTASENAATNAAQRPCGLLRRSLSVIFRRWSNGLWCVAVTVREARFHPTPGVAFHSLLATYLPPAS
jgi:hypothetical protein